MKTVTGVRVERSLTELLVQPLLRRAGGRSRRRIFCSLAFSQGPGSRARSAGSHFCPQF